MLQTCWLYLKCDTTVYIYIYFVINPITMNSIATFLNCTTVDRASDSMISVLDLFDAFNWCQFRCYVHKIILKQLISNDHEMGQSEPEIPPSKPKRETKLQIVKIQIEHMVHRVSSSFPKGGHLAALTELKIICINYKHKVKRHRN